MNKTLKTFAIPLFAIAGLLLVILWMAGAFYNKIDPDVLSTSKTYAGETFLINAVEQQGYEDVPATVRSKQTTNVAARILAPIKSIHVKAGDLVKTGDLLIELDNRNLRAQTAQSKENINSLQARLNQAYSHFRRTKSLYAKESVTKAQYEQALSSYNSLKAQLASAKQILESSQTTLSYSQIKAEFDGRVIDRFADPGDLASPGVKLLTLYDPNSLRIDANVRESLALSLKIGQQIQTHVSAINKTTMATIEEIVPAADPGTRSFLIKAKLEQTGTLLPGMFARIRIPIGTKNQLIIPMQYIKRIGQLDVVWVFENEQPVRRFIRIGEQIDDQVIIISGLNIGERLILPEALDNK